MRQKTGVEKGSGAKGLSCLFPTIQFEIIGITRIIRIDQIDHFGSMEGRTALAIAIFSFEFVIRLAISEEESCWHFDASRRDTIGESANFLA